MAEQSRVYGNFRGVDFTSDPAQVSPYRFSHCVNMWKDYESQNGIAVETFPGYRRLATAGGNANGIHKFGNKIYCHIGTMLYLLNGGQFVEKASGLADHKSTSFVWGDKLYILDGTDYWVYGETLKRVSENAYVPMAYLDASAVEQKNLLASKYKKSISLGGLERSFSPGLVYGEVEFASIADGSAMETVYAVTGWGLVPSLGVLKIPSEIEVSEGNYKTVEGLSLSRNDSEEIVSDVILPSTIRYLDASALDGYKYIRNIWFDGTQAQWNRLVSHNGNYTVVEDKWKKRGISIHIDETPPVDVLFTAEEISNGTIDGHSFGSLVYPDWYVTKQTTTEGNYLSVSNISKVSKKTIDFKESGVPDPAFPKCTIVQSFNGNLFFSGSPDAPSKIWWCAAPKDTGIPNPTYIGEYNFDLCGLDDSPIVSMMAQSSVLTVFKQKSDQDATIYYYSALQSESDLVPSIYAESEGGSGIACIGSSCNFLDDAVFLSKRGLEGIQKTAVNLERSVVHRSSFVDAKLQTEELSKAWLLEWKGYLCVLFPNGHMYLADSRRTASGNEGTEYEWFYVEGLQGYANEDDYPIYAYADEADLFELSAATQTPIDEDGYITLSDGNNEIKVTVKRGVAIDDIASKQAAVDAAFGEDAEVYSFNVDTSEGTQTVYYTKDGYLCYPSGEYADESGEAITCAAVIDDVLYFGAGGALYCINTDKRKGDTIPNEWYTFCGRRYKSGFVTFADNCGAPHLRKKIVKKSLVVKTKSMDNSKFYLKVGTDRVPFNENEEVHTSGTLDFGSFKFDTMDFFDQDKTIVPFRASAKKFVEAQLMLYSDGYKRPFGVYNMAFRFEVTGRVKE